MNLRDLQQAGFQRTPRIIQDTTIFDKQRQVPFIINAFYPANPVATPGKFIRTNGFKCDPRATLDFRFKRLQSHALKGIFGFGVFPVGTVTPVALRDHYRFGHRQGVLQRQIAKLARGTGIRFLITMLNRQTAAHQQVKADQLAVFGNRHKVHVVGVQIDIVLWRDHYRGFELTRQIGLPEDRLFIGGRYLLLIEPDLRIGASARQQMFRDLLRPFVGFRVQLRFVRVGGAQHVTVHVVGGRQRVQTDRMQHLVHRLDVLLQNAMELEGLAVGQTDTAINRVIRREFIDRLPLRRSNHPARQAAAQQHGVARLQLLRRTLGANIAVILLIHAMKAY
ncbi:hypothetical protein NGUA15_03571 [Salmonella enterica]|nr:hypothetical protein NGUA15_03571 [Salmonella enterica]